MGASARLVVQMTPETKDALNQRARRAGVTTSEYVRRLIADDLEEWLEEIRAILTAAIESLADDPTEQDPAAE